MATEIRGTLFLEIRETLFPEINEMIKSLFSWLVIFVFVGLFLFFFNIRGGFPIVSTDSLSLTIFQKIYSDLVPSNIKLLVVNPLNVILIQIQVSLFFAFILSSPILIYKLVRYLSPALYRHEKKAVLESLVPSVALFILGTLFAYFLLVPMTLRIMNSYNLALNATTYFEINQFITFALVAILVSGVSFMLPIFMKTLSFLGIVNRRVWLANFKYSLIAIVIFTAIITPDGTGVTMLMLSLPLIFLYLLGCFLSMSEEVSLVGI